MIRPLLTAAVALGLLFAANQVGAHADSAKNAERDPQDLAYLPEGAVLRTASLGHRALMADLIWLKAIQYYGEQRLTTRNYDQAERLFTVIYDLDPHFVEATRFGALVLSQDAGNPEAAFRLLRRGEVDFPDRWEYPFDRAFIHQTITREYAEAGEAYQRAAGLEGAPDLAIRLAGLSFARLGDHDTAREIWRAVLEETDNDLLISLGERSLRNLDLSEAEEKLTAAVLAFLEQSDEPITSLQQLVDVGLLSGAVPSEPWGGRWLWVPDRREVLGTTTIDRRMKPIAEHCLMLARKFKEQHGTFPPSPAVLLDAGWIDTMPWAPVGVALDWDPNSERIAWNPPWPATESREIGGTPQ